MKRIFVAIALVGGLMSCEAAEKVTEEVVETAVETTEEAIEESKTGFGLVAVNKDEAISTEEMLAQFEGKTELETTFKGEITEVCSKMGCWVSVSNPDEAGEDYMVRFKDHFTIPVDTEIGSTAYLHGVAMQDTVSVEMQRHLLEDAGKSPEEAEAMVTEAKITMTFFADGIELAGKE